MLNSKGLSQQDTLKPQAIIGGDFADGNPGYVVSLHDLVSFLGGGVILDSRTILTSAHVADNFRNAPQFINVRAGSKFRTVSSQNSNASEIFLHPDWVLNSTAVDFDLAIIKLNTPLVFDDKVKPIEFNRNCEVSENDFSIGNLTTLYGWGSTQVSDPSVVPGSLKEISENIIDLQNSSFWTTVPDFQEFYNTNSMFAVGSSTGQAYRGDSGGPCIIEKNGKSYLAGIISWGIYPELSNDPSLFYPTILADVGSSIDFITSHLECNVSPLLNQSTAVLCTASIDLNDYIIGSTPAGLTLVWSTDCYPIDGVQPIISSNVSQTDEYYAYYYNPTLDCYSKPQKLSVIPTCSNEGDLIVTSNITLNANTTYNKIKVKSGLTLTITPNTIIQIIDKIEVEMGAKLIVDGATITKCELCSTWEGIKVAGDLFYTWGFGPPTTEVIVKNGGSITQALTGIDAVGQITIFTTSDIGGAKITIEGNSTISDCEIGVKLGPIYGLNDLSVFDNATFSNNEIGIQINGNNGLNIKNSIFKYNSYLDIEAIRSSIVADNNTFNTSIELRSEYPVFIGSKFTNNDFLVQDGTIYNTIGGALSIDALANSTDFYIQNNEFFGTGIYVTGELDFDIRNNDFHESVEGTWISDSGDNINNFVTANNFYGNNYGNSASGINDTEYEKNCFSATDTWDIEVNDGASIHESQGVADDAAGNCFSKKIGTPITSEPFDYYVLKNTIPQSCKKPGSGGNFTEEVASQDIANSCGTGNNIYGPIPARYRDCTYTNATDLKQMIDYLRNQILILQANTTMNPWIKKWLIAKYKRCLDRAIKFKAKSDLDQKGKDSTIVFLVAQPEFRYQAAAYGIYMAHNETSKARTVLNGLPTNDAGESEFIDVQNIYLDYLADRANYTLSTTDNTAIYNAGLRKHPLAGFARSVYHTITGQKIPVTLTHLNGNTQIRVKDIVKPDISIFPNPAENGMFNIELASFTEGDEIVSLVYNLYGQVIQSNQLTQKQTQIEIPNVQSGMYLVQIMVNKTVAHSGKLIVK